LLQVGGQVWGGQEGAGGVKKRQADKQTGLIKKTKGLEVQQQNSLQ